MKTKEYLMDIDGNKRNAMRTFWELDGNKRILMGY